MSGGLVADIGGTHARLALVSDDDAGPGTRCANRVETIYECRTLNSVHQLLDQYRETAGGKFPKRACIAVAGPIHGDLVSLTNLDWRFSIDALRSRFGFDRLEVINDLKATAFAIPYLSGADLADLKTGQSCVNGTRAVIGVGTGLGVSAAVSEDDHWLAIASEGGHVKISPFDEQEAEILATIRRTTDQVCAETVLSGAGLVRLYRALAQIHGHTTIAVTPEQIVDAASDGQDTLSRQTVELFCRMLGGFAAETAMTFCATGGVYLTGQLLKAIAPTLASEHFLSRFCADRPMKALLDDIPVRLITASQPGLIGAQARLALDDQPHSQPRQPGSA